MNHISFRKIQRRAGAKRAHGGDGKGGGRRRAVDPEGQPEGRAHCQGAGARRRAPVPRVLPVCATWCEVAEPRPCHRRRAFTSAAPADPRGRPRQGRLHEWLQGRRQDLHDRGGGRGDGGQDAGRAPRDEADGAHRAARVQGARERGHQGAASGRGRGLLCGGTNGVQTCQRRCGRARGPARTNCAPPSPSHARLQIHRELYFAILMDRGAGGPVLVASTQGGMDIEEVRAPRTRARRAGERSPGGRETSGHGDPRPSAPAPSLRFRSRRSTPRRS